MYQGAERATRHCLWNSVSCRPCASTSQTKDHESILYREQWMPVRYDFARRADLKPHEVATPLADRDHIARHKRNNLSPRASRPMRRRTGPQRAPLHCTQQLAPRSPPGRAAPGRRSPCAVRRHQEPCGYLGLGHTPTRPKPFLFALKNRGGHFAPNTLDLSRAANSRASRVVIAFSAM